MMVENIVELPDFTVSTLEIHTIDGDLFALPSDMSPRHRGSRDRVARVSEVVALNEELAAFSAIEAQIGRRYRDTLVDEASPYSDIQFPALFEEELNIFGVEAVDLPPSPSFRSGSDEDSSSETAKHRSKSKKNRNLPTKGKRRRQPHVVEIVDIHPILLAGEDVEIDVLELSEHRRTPKRPTSPQSLSNSHYTNSDDSNSSSRTPFAPPSTPQPGSQQQQQHSTQPMTPSTPTSSTLPFLAPTPRRPKGTPGSKSAAAKERKEKRSAAAAANSTSSGDSNAVGDPKSAASVDIRTLSFQGEEVLRIKQINTEESVEVDVGDDFDC